jgi:Kef-type K+ transport system membrane component KefB
MAISAMVIIARVLRELDLVKSDLGLVTLCGYAVNDILAWVIFSFVLAATTASGMGAMSITSLFVITIAFTILCLTLGPRVTDRAISLLGTGLPQQPGAVLTFVACLGLLCGAITAGLGLTALLGFFLAGIMAGEARALSERVRNTLTQMVHAIFVPLYFASIALRVDFAANFDLFLVVFVTFVSIGAKFLGAWLGAFGTGVSREDRVSIGIAFTPSGVTGIVVGSVALEAGILTVPVFVAIVFSAVASSLVIGPWLTWSIRRRRAVNVLDYFAPAAVSADLQGSTRSDVLRELSERLASGRPDLETEGLFAEVEPREELMGTGLGHGIAVAHARLATLARPLLTYGRSLAGVDWDAPDGLPVQHVFLLLTPVHDQGLQLQILAAIARGMTPDEPRERLAQATGAEEIWAALETVLREQQLTQVRTAA